MLAQVNQLYANSGGVDFVLCIGDDSADEHMFAALQARFGELGGTPGAPAVFTTVVGRKPSAAHYFLNDSDEVLGLCQSLRLHSTRANRNRSMGDLQRLHSERLRASHLARPGVPRLQTAGADLGPANALDWSRQYGL